jgi:hypothetical protein
MRDEALAAYHDLQSKAREGHAIRKAADAGIKASFQNGDERQPAHHCKSEVVNR